MFENFKTNTWIPKSKLFMICDLFSWVQIKSAINYEKRTEKTQNKTKQMLRSKNFRVEILFEGDVLNYDSLSMLIIQRNWTVFHSIILDYIRYLSSYFHLPPIKRNEKKKKKKKKKKRRTFFGHHCRHLRTKDALGAVRKSFLIMKFLDQLFRNF